MCQNAFPIVGKNIYVVLGYVVFSQENTGINVLHASQGFTVII